VDVSTQEPLHSVVPVGQTQCPPLQICVAPQGMLQPPQWSASLCVSMQLAPQRVRPELHVVPQTPSSQT